MNAKRASSSNNWRRRAFTLVEVVASLMLLGTLLVGILVAHRRHAHQIRRAKARLAAVEAADKLLLKWTEEGSWGPAANSGPCEGTTNLFWHWSVISAPQVERLGAALGRLEIMEGSATPADPLVRLDLLTTGTNSPPTIAGKTP